VSERGNQKWRRYVSNEIDEEARKRLLEIEEARKRLFPEFDEKSYALGALLYLVFLIAFLVSRPQAIEGVFLAFRG